VKIADAVALITGPDVDVAFTAYDGSRIGPNDADVRLDIRTPRAVSYILSSPGQLGIARAYVTGDLEVHGDLFTLLDRLARLGVEMPSNADKVRRSTRSRAGIHAHHYDVSNRFYSLGARPVDGLHLRGLPEREASLEQAQEEKFDLVCRKLGLSRGMRLLDVGCGWGGMVMHAVKHYGVQGDRRHAVAAAGRVRPEAIEQAGADRPAEIRFSDYRNVAESGFDAVSSIGLTEHIGIAPTTRRTSSTSSLSRCAPGPAAQPLHHPPERRQPRHFGKAFIARYVFPDGELPARARS
jgi:cyclopropane-fatty-acyl-phospholipid synthase